MRRFICQALAVLVFASSPATAWHITTVADDLRDPMELAVAPDGDVYIAEREGRLLRVHPPTGAVHVVGNLHVSALRASEKDSPWGRECGLLGLALAPDFATSRQLYLYWSHPDKLQNHLSRFTLRDGLLDPASEQTLLIVPTDRHQLSTHMAGCLQFAPDGCLFLSTGDNVNPFDSEGHAPIDDRPGREHANAMRTSGSTDDLRGKILRIRPTAAGCEIPPGNLFPPGTPRTRPEIYIMGCRNPFRLSVDERTGTLYWGEVGPDAGAATARGPAGHDEINQARQPGNHGWPFVIADNIPYPIVDFATGTIGALTDPAAPRNPSRLNTGLEVLPRARPAFIWYPYAASERFPELGSGGRNAMAGPVVRHDSARRWNLFPAETGRSLLIYDWMRGRAWRAALDDAEKLVRIVPVLDGLMHPIDMALTPDGALMVLEYGSEWYFNGNGRLRRILPDQPQPPPAVAIREHPDGSFIAESSPDATLTWRVTSGAEDRVVGSGAALMLPDRQGIRELRAVATDKAGHAAIARRTFDATTQPSLALALAGNPVAAACGSTVRFTVGGAPHLKSLVVRARYIPPTGHDSGSPVLPQPAAAIAGERQCAACHNVDAPSVGPRFLDVALRYHADPEAPTRLRRKLATGGAGAWGSIPMPPQVALTDDEAERFIASLLSMARGIAESRDQLSGSLRLPSAPPDKAPGGSWEFSADAPGFISARLRIAAE